MQSIEITSLVGHPPFSITICDITYTYCYFAISGVTSAPITITPPTQLNGVNQLLVVITDSKGCETINYINCFTPTPTPTLTPTPTITPTNLSCSCIAFINVGTGNLNFGYILCDETIFTGVIPQSTTFYVCGKLPFADEDVIISINDVCVDNSCPTSEITPTPTNTPTPTLTPTITPTQTMTPSPTPQYRFEPNDSAYLIDFIDNSTSGYFYGAYTGYSENNVVPAGGIIKLNQDLTIDYSFTGGTGFAGPYDYFYNGESIIQQPDGKIIATGFLTSYSGVSKNRIVRLNVDGSIDNTFVMGSGFNGFYTAVPGIDSLGNIIVPGYFSTYNGVTTPIYGLAKLSSGGTMDMTFSATTGFAGAPTIPQGVLVNPDDSMYVTGYFTSFSGISANHIIKLQSNGYKDDSFNYGTGFNSYGEEAINTFRISGETSFYVVGTNYNGGGFTMYNGTPVNRILKLMSDGTIDPSFNSGTGLSGGTADLSSYCTIIWTNKLLLWGTFTSYNGTPSLNWIILNSDGTVFQSFTTEYNLIFAIGNKLYGQQSTGYLELIMTYP
jgi:hypothetical protein